MTAKREFFLNSRDDLTYLEALVDMSPSLSERSGMQDPLTDQWKAIIKALIAIAKEAADG